jgi:hypothetical protein
MAHLTSLRAQARYFTAASPLLHLGEAQTSLTFANSQCLLYNHFDKLEFGEKEEKDYMGSIAALFMYLMIIGFIAVVAYFVIKKSNQRCFKRISQ